MGIYGTYVAKSADLRRHEWIHKTKSKSNKNQMFNTQKMDSMEETAGWQGHHKTGNRLRTMKTKRSPKREFTYAHMHAYNHKRTGLKNCINDEDLMWVEVTTYVEYMRLTLTQGIKGRSSVHTPMCSLDTNSLIFANGSRYCDPLKLFRLL